MSDRFALHHGDCLEVLAAISDCSIDSVVCDPPYGLSFMGRKWDYDVPSEAIWRECLRVLKPGGHLLAFAGTRTQHRMAVRIEDAGFEIRDMIAWVYGCLSDDSEVLTRNGRERYHTARHKEILAYDPEADVYQWERPSRWSEYRVESDTAYRLESDSTDQIVSRGHRCLVERDGVLSFVPADELSSVERVPYLQGSVFALPQRCRELLLEAVLRQGEGLAEAALGERKGQETSWQRVDGAKKSGVERRLDVLQEKGQVRQPINQICSVPSGVFMHGPQGRVCDGAPSGSSDAGGETAVAERVRPPHKPRRNGQQVRELDAVCDERRSQAVRARPTYQTTLATVTPVKYTGLIFCPTVSTGAFVARRNGMVFLTGNSGFPKSHDVSKAIDKLAGRIGYATESIKGILRKAHQGSGRTLTQLNEVCGFEASGYLRDSSTWASVLPPQDKWPVIRDALDLPTELDSLFAEAEREVIGIQKRGNSVNTNFMSGGNDITAPATETAKQWQGWGTALKPAMEPITVARKPLTGTVAANVLQHGTGAINVDGCRVATNPSVDDPRLGGNGSWSSEKMAKNVYEGGYKGEQVSSSPLGRFPANFIHDGSDEVTALFPQTTSGSISLHHTRSTSKTKNNYGARAAPPEQTFGDSGSAARFFYCAKASKKDRGDQNNHPTVKPTDLMRYLCRLVTPPGGLILDPFMGSGSTGKAAMIEGFRFIGIEREAEYLEIAQARIAHAVGKTNDMLAFE